MGKSSVLKKKNDTRKDKKYKTNKISGSVFKNQKLKNKILSGCFIACAIIWNLVLALDFVYGQNDRGVIVMHIISALAWTVAAVGWFLRMKKLEKISKIRQDTSKKPDRG